MQGDVEACLVGPPQNAATYALMARRHLSTKISRCITVPEDMFLLLFMHTQHKNSTVSRFNTQCVSI